VSAPVGSTDIGVSPAGAVPGEPWLDGWAQLASSQANKIRNETKREVLLVMGESSFDAIYLFGLVNTRPNDRIVLLMLWTLGW
jgi:hypothetical protein